MTTARIGIEQTADLPDEEPVAEAPLMDHSYDGIREYDNPLPGWWRGIFWGSIVFAGFYGLYFHVVDWGTSPADRYRASLATWESQRTERDRAEMSRVTEQSLAQLTNDGKVVARGADVFKARCASCHGPEGAGLIGPNLTDDRQVHGSSRLDIFRTVRGGVAGTAMAAWGDQLPPADVLAASAFAITLRGQLLRGKAPEGAPVGPFSP
jgi:cytochrome c oxidase cbb3-type subunit 3